MTGEARAPDLEPERWERLVPYLARARAKPTWDVEEREPKQLVAERLREALAAPDEPALRQRVRRLELAARARYGLLRPEDIAWLERWAAEDAVSLAGALAAFSGRDPDPVARFEAWAASPRCSANPDAALAVGSLFNFAFEPTRMPIVSEPIFRRLEADLGHRAEPADALGARYRHRLDFAQLLQARLSDAGVGVRDMVDVQSLIFIAVRERDLWAVDPPPDGWLAADRAPGAYLAVCAIYRDEAPYLREWIEFHRLVGVERFFLYDNRSTDDHLRVLAPYSNEGIVAVHEWPESPGQIAAYENCLETHGRDARWIAFLDVDEFLFSPELRPLPEVLRDYGRYPAVGVNRATFGASGHRTRPPGLAIESYLRRGGRNLHVKSVVQPRAAIRCLSAHRFEYRHGLAVDENGYPIQGDMTKSLSFERLRINHYFTRSEDELRAKMGTPRADYGQTRPGSVEQVLDRFDGVSDDLITAYAPQLRAAVARSGAAARDIV